MNKNLIITGGAGFIGSAMVRHIINNTDYNATIVDSLTYSGKLSNFKDIGKATERYHFYPTNIKDVDELKSILIRHKPIGVIHLAAETHVDRSIDCPDKFVDTNIVGTHSLLKSVYSYWKSLEQQDKNSFKFIHVSTDEVFGHLHDSGFFNESSNYRPRSPYAASKASSDHLVKSYFWTYGFPAIVTNCTNNYGPYQHDEKLIPTIIKNALSNKPIPIYGTGHNVRDWIHVDDHVEALMAILENGAIGESYCVGALNEFTNLEIANIICDILDQLRPMEKSKYSDLITLVNDRPGHDFRYAVSPAKISKELNWKAKIKFKEGLTNTIKWYMESHPK